MKRLLLLSLFALFTYSASAQAGSGFGIKGGLNYNANGDYFESAGEAARNPDRNVGYHLGIWGKLGNDIYLRPELVYTRTKSDYNGDDFDMTKLDLPVLLGIKVIGPLHVFAGPAFQYILDTEFDGISIDDVDNDFTVGVNIGAGINLGKLGIDLRYERGLGDNEANFINTNITTIGASRIDTRPDQLILSLSLKL
ncbi:Outer membrane protein beta-barrel domain-containing protein [Robiginitalea myxolifaciens]|uniref:Outer membrane protein beta-barrel domain-containing protein n=1 Tax=Robiginitalea myxolifaciens TaxID=400055 RepID=A0A1I6H5E8_9FLAO|nr:outer membrane beta-barrel protein [Robiginitalea myxolifaciens]SFR49756.1 Outer membrane protein beta-barrel domain-containing protein [Robiginitalea myxolifaciens]